MLLLLLGLLSNLYDGIIILNYRFQQHGVTNAKQIWRKVKKKR